MMAEQELVEVINLLEAEPSSSPAGSSIVPDLTSLTVPGPNIPALREQLAVLVSTGKSKEAIGVQLTHEQLKRLTDKEVEKYYKRYETFVGSKTTESMVDSLLTLLTRGLQMVVEIDDIDAMKKELKEDFIINKEMTDFVGSLSLKYGKFLAPISAALITAKHIDFNSHLEKNDKAKLKKFLSIPHQLLNICRQILSNCIIILFA